MPSSDGLSPVAPVIGAGDATGGAVARRFARGGYTVCATRRSADKLQPLVAQIEAEGVGADVEHQHLGRTDARLDVLDQRMAREPWPRGIHVCHSIIADAYRMLHEQPRDAWTHGLDLRPWMEKF